MPECIPCTHKHSVQVPLGQGPSYVSITMRCKTACCLQVGVEKLGALRVLYCSNNKIKDWSEADRLGPLVSTHNTCTHEAWSPIRAGTLLQVGLPCDVSLRSQALEQGESPGVPSQRRHSGASTSILLGTLLQL